MKVSNDVHKNTEIQVQYKIMLLICHTVHIEYIKYIENAERAHIF